MADKNSLNRAANREKYPLAPCHLRAVCTTPPCSGAAAERVATIAARANGHDRHDW